MHSNNYNICIKNQLRIFVLFKSQIAMLLWSLYILFDIWDN